MSGSLADSLDEKLVRGATLCQTLHWLAHGRLEAKQLTGIYLDAIARSNPGLNAYIDLHADAARDAAAASALRRGTGGAIGRLDGLPVALKDNIDVAGWPTSCGFPSRRQMAASHDAACVAKLRHAGAVILGKTNLDEGVLGSSTANPHFGPTHNPLRHGVTAGGSSGGAAAAVAAGLCVAAIGSDSLGSVRIPASYCGIAALKPTHGEISARGLVPTARRLDTVGLLARSVGDLTVLLQVLAGYDADDPRSRKRRVALAPPDWEPGRLRCGLIPNLAKLGCEPGVVDVFEKAIDTLRRELGELRALSFGDYPLEKARRAGFFLMEAEMLSTYSDEIADTASPISPKLRGLLEWAQSKRAVDYVSADRLLDASVLKARRVFAEVDVLVTPTTPQGAFSLDAAEPASTALFTSFANLSGCPAVSIPMGRLPDGMPVGMQFVGPPGSDLRLLELAEVCASTLDAAPNYPVSH
jgi:Asp-tRNA(Asn)/Glu-tRNA(Gln) amidotransferase A subunit family amidase